jgi:nitrate reductase gamma subunit
MDAWIEFARGPLFRACLALLVLGLGYRLALALTSVAAAWRRAGDRALPWRAITRGTAEWVVPVRLLRSRPALSVASFLFHVGLVVAPLFLIGHVALLAGVLPAWWPVLNTTVADVVTLVAVAACLFLFASRLAPGPTRALTGTGDLALLVVLFLVLLTGLLAAHPAWSPIDARARCSSTSCSATRPWSGPDDQDRPLRAVPADPAVQRTRLAQLAARRGRPDRVALAKENEASEPLGAAAPWAGGTGRGENDRDGKRCETRVDRIDRLWRSGAACAAAAGARRRSAAGRRRERR